MGRNEDTTRLRNRVEHLCFGLIVLGLALVGFGVLIWSGGLGWLGDLPGS